MPLYRRMGRSLPFPSLPFPSLPITPKFVQRRLCTRIASPLPDTVTGSKPKVSASIPPHHIPNALSRSLDVARTHSLRSISLTMFDLENRGVCRLLELDVHSFFADLRPLYKPHDHHQRCLQEKRKRETRAVRSMFRWSLLG